MRIQFNLIQFYLFCKLNKLKVLKLQRSSTIKILFIQKTCRRPEENQSSNHQAPYNHKIRKTHLSNLAALYKILKRVSEHPGKLCDKEFRDVIVWCQIKFLKQIVIFMILIRWFSSLLLKSGVEVIVFASLSVRLF